VVVRPSQVSLLRSRAPWVRPKLVLLAKHPLEGLSGRTRALDTACVVMSASDTSSKLTATRF